MGSPRVTVGMPVHNAERFLREAIDSVLAQDEDQLEVLLADNASTDSTPEICREYAAKDERVRFLPSDVNRGLAWNHNRVAEAATAPYFKWAAYDDVYHPTFVSRCVEALEARPEAVLAYTNTVDIDADGNELARWPATDRASTGEPWQRFRDVLLNERQCFPIYGVMRTAVLQRTNLMGTFPSSDQPLLAELALHGPFVEVHEPLFLHREHAGRSMALYPDAHDRMAFYDPARVGHLSMPKWRVLAGYVGAISRAPVPARQRARALASLLHWVNDWRLALAADVVGVGRELVRRARRRPH